MFVVTTWSPSLSPGSFIHLVCVSDCCCCAAVSRRKAARKWTAFPLVAREAQTPTATGWTTPVWGRVSSSTTRTSTLAHVTDTLTHMHRWTMGVRWGLGGLQQHLKWLLRSSVSSAEGSSQFSAAGVQQRIWRPPFSWWWRFCRPDDAFVSPRNEQPQRDRRGRSHRHEDLLTAGLQGPGGQRPDGPEHAPADVKW